MDLAVYLWVALGIAGLLALYMFNSSKPASRPKFHARLKFDTEWQLAHPFETEVVRIMELALKREITILSQNLDAPFDMIVGADRQAQVLIKCADFPAKPTPMIYLDRLILAKERTDARRVYLVSTGYFSRQMRVDAADNGVILISGQDFHNLQRKYPKAGNPSHDAITLVSHERYRRPR